MSHENLAMEVAAFRLGIRETFATVAAKDSLNAPLTDIAQEFEALWNRFLKLEERLKREKDARRVAEASPEWKENYAKLEASHAEYKTAMDFALEAGARKVKEAKASLAALETDVKAVREHLAVSMQEATAALQKLLMRPHRLMELYGQEVYQEAKDVFVSLGGNGTAIPAPEVNRFAEMHDGDGDAD